jgi:hypothetical protein
LDAYIHGSLSTMDYTEFSDLDTLFIIKSDFLTEPDHIRELEKKFVKSLRFLYEFDLLQHHGHFILTELDLRFYNQSFLPLSSIELSTSILGKATNLDFSVRNSKHECSKRFTESINIIRRCAKDKNIIRNPYRLKGMLSHFMILPALFLQLEGNYISKKASFAVFKERIPTHFWATMDKVSSIRQNWKLRQAFYLRELVKAVGAINPLLLPYLGKNIPRLGSLDKASVSPKLFNEISNFAEYLANLSGIDAQRFDS